MFLTFFKLPINYQELIQLLQYLKVRGLYQHNPSFNRMAWNTWRKRPEKITKELADRHLRYPCPRDGALSCGESQIRQISWVSWNELPEASALYPSMIRLPSRACVSFPPVSPEACKVNNPSLPSPIPRQKNRKVGLVAKVKSRTVKLITELQPEP